MREREREKERERENERYLVWKSVSSVLAVYSKSLMTLLNSLSKDKQTSSISLSLSRSR
jgi:hypothetical protein